MIDKQSVIDKLVKEKNEMIEGLTPDEKADVDIYFDSLVNELDPMLSVFNKLRTDEAFMSGITKAIKEHIKEDQWLEKLSKTFYDLETTPDH